MGFIDQVLKGFLGDKNAKDLKEVKKVVAKIKAAEPSIESLSDDGLRDKTAEFKSRIKEASSAITTEIENIKQQISQTSDIDAKEALNKLKEKYAI